MPSNLVPGGGVGVKTAESDTRLHRVAESVVDGSVGGPAVVRLDVSPPHRRCNRREFGFGVEGFGTAYLPRLLGSGEGVHTLDSIEDAVGGAANGVVRAGGVDVAAVAGVEVQRNVGHI